MPDMFPGRILLEGYDHTQRSNVLRTQTESGPPKQRRQLDRVLYRRNIRLLLTGAEHDAFRAWFANDVGQGSAWFDFRDEIEATNGDPVRQVRIVSGELTSFAWLNHWKGHGVAEFAIEYYE